MTIIVTVYNYFFYCDTYTHQVPGANTYMLDTTVRLMKNHVRSLVQLISQRRKSKRWLIYMQQKENSPYNLKIKLN